MQQNWLSIFILPIVSSFLEHRRQSWTPSSLSLRPWHSHADRGNVYTHNHSSNPSGSGRGQWILWNLYQDLCKTFENSLLRFCVPCKSCPRALSTCHDEEKNLGDQTVASTPALFVDALSRSLDQDSTKPLLLCSSRKCRCKSTSGWSDRAEIRVSVAKSASCLSWSYQENAVSCNGRVLTDFHKPN